MAPGANIPPPTASCDQLNSAGQDDHDESMALLDEEHRESGNESDVAPSLNEEEEEPGDGITGKTSVDLLIFSCKDSLDLKKMALVFRRSFKSVNDQLYSSLIRFLVSTALADTMNCNNLLVIPLLSL